MKNILLAIIFAIFVAPLSVFAAVASDNSAYTTSASTSYTSTGTNLAMVVFIRYTTSGGTPTITYNGVSLTNIDTTGVGGTNNSMASYYLAAPATGSHTLSVNSGSLVALSVMTYTGVSQSASPASHAAQSDSGTGSGSNPQVSDTVVNNNAWVAVGLSSDNGSASTVTNWTRRGSFTSQLNAGDTNATVSAGSITFSAHYAGNFANSGMEAIELAPFVVSTISNHQDLISFQ